MNTKSTGITMNMKEVGQSIKDVEWGKLNMEQ